VIGTSSANTFDFRGLAGVTGLTYVDGGSGNDSITGSWLVDDLRGGSGNDWLDGGEGDDRLAGGAGLDTVNGGGGNDTIVVTGTEAQTDTMWGGDGEDSILVLGTSKLTLGGFNAAASSIESWQGNGLAVIGTTAADVFDFSDLQSVTGLAYADGGSGNDTITGSQFADDLRGGSGNDWLDGGLGDDLLNGGYNNDTLVGGSGRDTLWGGAAADTFVFLAYEDSGVGADADVIVDFSAAQLDRIDLTALDANLVADGDDAFSFIGNGEFTGDAGQLRFADGVLMPDYNGDAMSDFELALTGVTTLAGSLLLL
jgi:Ca2+-binding RTX toxin-like protein